MVNHSFKYHSRQYPTLFKMACDYLAIQGSSVASKRAFSSAAISDDLQHNKTESKAFGNLQILKFAYKTNFLNASDEAATHKPYHVLELD
jgi:hAT family C-terminal dimerisation region